MILIKRFSQVGMEVRAENIELSVTLILCIGIVYWYCVLTLSYCV